MKSSDIKSRTYLDYRKDMKQKAIAELEILLWLNSKIKEVKKTAKVEKYRGDKSQKFIKTFQIST